LTTKISKEIERYKGENRMGVPQTNRDLQYWRLKREYEKYETNER
jgi:hypothetical protein